jgi:hypothetical protein
LYILPFILLINNLDHRASRHAVSKAFLKSTNEAKSFFFLNFISQELDTYLKLFILLYADDTVILAESSDDMQNQINYFYDFCKKWRLKVNIEKLINYVFCLSLIPHTWP